MRRFHVQVWMGDDAGDDALRRYLQGFRDGDPLRAGPALDCIAETPQAAAEQAFAFYNADERPNRFSERSVSIGDVACVRDVDEPTDIQWWAYRAIGVEQVDPPSGVGQAHAPH